MQISGLIENYNECPYTISIIKKECVSQENLHCRNILWVTYICKYLLLHQRIALVNIYFFSRTCTRSRTLYANCNQKL